MSAIRTLKRSIRERETGSRATPDNEKAPFHGRPGARKKRQRRERRNAVVRASRKVNRA